MSEKEVWISPDERSAYHAPTDQRGVGAKHDGGKLRWSLLPWGALKQVVAAMEFGAKKYAEGFLQGYSLTAQLCAFAQL